jgi:hypothetical protein
MGRLHHSEVTDVELSVEYGEVKVFIEQRSGTDEITSTGDST